MAAILTVLVCTTLCVAAPLRVIDGDTIKLADETIRLLDVDAPETFRHHCPVELVKGLAAKDELQRLLDRQTITVSRHGQDRYRRTLARIAVPAGDVGTIMMREGFSIPWRPGRQAYEDRTEKWCN